MNRISKRLEVIASYAYDNSKIIDIGCDHGLLSIYLAKKYKNVKIIASDVNQNALNNAINNINKEHLDKRIDTRLGSGLDVVRAEEIDTIIISGMGANTIVGILKYSTDKLKNVNTLIIQSNTDLYFLRKNVTELGYYIEDETLVEEANIIYTVIKFSKGKKRYNYKELYLGPILIKKNDKLFNKIIDKEKKTIMMILSRIKKGHLLYRLKLRRNLNILKMIENGY